MPIKDPAAGGALGAGVPDANHAVIAARGQVSAAGREAHAHHLILVPKQHAALVGPGVRTRRLKRAYKARVTGIYSM